MEKYLIFNGNLIRAEQPVLLASNRSYKYGDGLFETLTFLEGRILHSTQHFNRLFSSLKLLKYKIPAGWEQSYFEEQIHTLCAYSKLSHFRVRLSVFRGDGHFGNTENTPGYIIEVSELPENAYQWHDSGLRVDAYTEDQKSCGRFSNLKTANYLLSVMAAQFANENKLDDALILNTRNKVCESTVANIFIVKNDQIITPPLDDGPVAGIIRGIIMQESSKLSVPVIEREVDIETLEESAEIFLTNAIQPIRWVQSFRGTKYTHEIGEYIFNKLFKHFKG